MERKKLLAMRFRPWFKDRIPFTRQWRRTTESETMQVRAIEQAFEASSYGWIQSRYGAAWCKWIEGPDIDLRVAVTLTSGILRVDVGEYHDNGSKREYTYTVDPEGIDSLRIERFILDAELASRDWEREITR